MRLHDLEGEAIEQQMTSFYIGLSDVITFEQSAFNCFII